MEAAVAALMSQEGPIVSCVHLKADGGKETIKMDMTPKKNAIAQLLGGITAIAGALPAIDVVAVCRRDGLTEDAETPAAPSKSSKPLSMLEKLDKMKGNKKSGGASGSTALPANQHTLPPPITDVHVRGGILLVRMNAESTPEDFTVKEYNAYVANPPAPAASDDSSEEGSDESEASDGNEGESGDDKVMSDKQADAVLVEVAANFRKQHKRDATAEELMELLSEKYGISAGNEESGDEAQIEEDSDDDDAEEAAAPVGKKGAKRRSPKAAGRRKGDKKLKR